MRSTLIELLRTRKGGRTRAMMAERLGLLARWGDNYEQAYAEASGIELVFVLLALGVTSAEVEGGRRSKQPLRAVRALFPLSRLPVVEESLRAGCRRPLLELMPNLDPEESPGRELREFGTDYERAYRDGDKVLGTVLLALGGDAIAVAHALADGEVPRPSHLSDDALRLRFPIATLLTGNA